SIVRVSEISAKPSSQFGEISPPSSRPGSRKTLTETFSGASEVTAGCAAAGDMASIDSRSGQRRIMPRESGARFEGGGDRRLAIGGHFDPPARAVAVEPLALPAFVDNARVVPIPVEPALDEI